MRDLVVNRVGRGPHPRYFKVMRAMPDAPAEQLVAAKREWLRRCEQRGLKPSATRDAGRWRAGEPLIVPLPLSPSPVVTVFVS